MARDSSADRGARGVQLSAFRFGDLQAVGQVVVRIHLRVLCVRVTHRSTTTQLPRDRGPHPADSQRFRISSSSFYGAGFDECLNALA